MAVLTAEALAPKIREMQGNLAAVARAFGVTRNAVWNFVNRHPTLQEVCRECREAMKDHGESSLYKAVLNGEAWAVCFYLKTQAKDRGYVEKTEHEHRGNLTVEVTEVVVRTRAEAKAALSIMAEAGGVPGLNGHGPGLRGGPGLGQVEGGGL